MKNELFQIGPLTVYGYGFMIALGVLSAWLVTALRAKNQKLSEDQVFSLVFWCLAGGLAGAKLLFWITEITEILADPSFILDTLADGFVVYGGILGGILAGWLCCRRAKADFFRYFDLVMPSVALAQGFGRLGCFLAGCCYGKETSGILAVTFHTSQYAPNGVALIPTQIYSSLLDFLNFAVLLLISRKKQTPGSTAACYLIFYSLGRFFMEFLRGDLIRGSVGILSTSQFISLFTALAGVLLLLYLRYTKSGKPSSPRGTSIAP